LTTAVRRSGVSPALVVAIVALFVALTGTGRAASPVSTTPASKVGLTYLYSTSTEPIAANTALGWYLTCPKGSYPVSGGLTDAATSGAYLQGSAPYNSVTKAYGGPADSWEVWVSNTTSTAVDATSYIVCASGVTETGTTSQTPHLKTGLPRPGH
jgi:hypothetical protein